MSDITGSLVEVINVQARKPKHAGGRPRIGKEKIELIAELLAHGLTEERVAKVLGIARVTIYEAKKQREFANTVLDAKETADREVVKSLYLSAVGYTHPEEKVFCHEGEIIVHNTTKRYPPNVGAATLWLINRQRAAWRKEVQHEENRPNTKAPMIRLFSKINGKEAAAIQASGDQMSVLLGDDFVAEVQESQRQKVVQNGTNGKH